jgi:phospholipid/cholesterol/gamma-HCH transport system substrate-binding protein
MSKDALFDYTWTEIAAGAFLLLALGGLGYLSISIGGFALLRDDRYHLQARFSNVGDLKAGAPIKIAGVTVGKVEAIRLVDYVADADLAIDRKVALPKDTIASIATAGLLGDAYVTLSPGAADQDLRSGERLTHTEPALNLVDLVAKYAFGKKSEEAAGEAAPAKPATQEPAR